MCLLVSYKKIMNFFSSLKSLKKGVGSGSAPKCHGSPTLSQTFNESLWKWFGSVTVQLKRSVVNQLTVVYFAAYGLRYVGLL
jgi:hypothetical protein